MASSQRGFEGNDRGVHIIEVILINTKKSFVCNSEYNCKYLFCFKLLCIMKGANLSDYQLG